MIVPPVWSEEELTESSEKAIGEFREERLTEPLESYLESFDVHRTTVENLIEGTVDLSLLREQAVELLVQPDQKMAVRYLASPAISEDDLKVVAEAVLTAGPLRADPEMARRIIDTVLLALDRNRFPWFSEDREPTEAELLAAVISTSALMATQTVQTARRTTAKNRQEQAVADRLLADNMTQVATHPIANLSTAPDPGQFCRECQLGSRKADLVVRLWDGRIMAIECKVSNSSTNSVKRLNNDAAVKAKTWHSEFGTVNVVPAAVLAGVFKTSNLAAAQRDGLALFWGHDLDAMSSFIEATK